MHDLNKMSIREIEQYLEQRKKKEQEVIVKCPNCNGYTKECQMCYGAGQITAILIALNPNSGCQICRDPNCEEPNAKH